jgi:GNAT superfamily N-acetyltransferase
MSPIDVLSLDLPGEIPDAWTDIAARVYADDPHYIPEDPAAVRRDLSVHNPWFGAGRARAFYVPERARVAAYLDPALHSGAERTLYFGDLVTSGDELAERALFAELSRYAHDLGATRLLGPIHMTTLQAYRVLVSIEPGGLPFPGEPYDNLEASQALARLGFSVAQRYHSHIGDHAGMAAARARIEPLAEKARVHGYRIAVEDPLSLEADLPTIYELSMRIYEGGYAFVRPPFSAWRSEVSAFLRRACPLTSVIARSRDGEVVGFLINAPHWGPLVVQGAEKRLTASELSYREHAHLLGKERRVVVKSLGVAPEHRATGVSSLIFSEVMKRSIENYTHCVGALMRDDNRSHAFGARDCCAVREYALYARAVSGLEDRA